MKAEQKAVQVVNVLSRDYVTLIGLEGLGLYVFLMRHSVTSLGSMNPAAMSKALNLDDEQFSILLKKLKLCGLISFKKKSEGKYSYKTLDFPTLSYPEKLHMLDQIYDEKLISYDEKKSAEFLLNLDHKHIAPSAPGITTKKPRTKKAIRTIDLEASEKRRNPNSFPALVDYYYSLLSKTFGIYCKSYNIVAEARLLKNSMRENNDSPEAVKKMFEYMISDAKARGKIELVNHVGLYTRKRTIAYYHVFAEPDTKATFDVGKKADEDTITDIKYIQQMFDYFKTKGFEDDIIIKDTLIPQFGEKSVQNFLDTRVTK
jgi:hypothetical protein